MELLLIVLVILLLCGGGYYGNRQWGPNGGLGIVGVLLVVVLLFWLLSGSLGVHHLRW